MLLVNAQASSGQATENQRKASEFAFDVADRNGDGVISEAELAYDTAAGFAGLDKDGDEHLVPGELQAHDAAAFGRVDTNNDGSLSFSEVIKVKLKVLEDAAESEYVAPGGPAPRRPCRYRLRAAGRCRICPSPGTASRCSQTG